MSRSKNAILFVDLDGTLIASEMLVEVIVPLIARQSRILAEIPGWLSHGRDRFRQALAQRVMPDIGQLPFRTDVLSFLAEQKSSGCSLVLATASDRRWAQSVADSLQLFDAVLASDGVRNLEGSRKLAAIEEYCATHGVEEFGYIGDSRADIPIWQRAANVYAVEPSRALIRELDRTGRLRRIFGEHRSKGLALVRLLRPQQWVKNILVFVPVVLAHRVTDRHAMFAALVSFFAFNVCASAAYVLNDVLDLQTDRQHPSKCHRPFACGAVPVSWSPWLVLGLLGVGLGLALAALSWPFCAVLLLYLSLTTLYSLWLKRLVLLDVFTLAGLYTIRIIGGGLAADIEISEWLLAFSMFLFTSLAFAKRFTELTRLASESQTASARRGYVTDDLALIESMGIASGYVAVLVLALYIHSPEVSRQYIHRWALWLICPIILYWISRIWLMAKRRQLTEDPLVFAFKDQASLVAGAGVAVLFVVAQFF